MGASISRIQFDLIVFVNTFAFVIVVPKTLPHI